MRFAIAFLLIFFFLTPSAAPAQSPAPGRTAELIRAVLVQIQLQMRDDPAGARARLAEAHDAYASMSPTNARYAPDADARARAGFTDAEQALTTGDAPAFAVARSHIWMAILAGGYDVVVGSLRAGYQDSATVVGSARVSSRHALLAPECRCCPCCT
ncbi:MAG: hypothetical protein RMJ55_04895 [Roseiflexaceae bacterium]|nr:hypothetical protein [Roseiflexaceae bacterium]